MRTRKKQPQPEGIPLTGGGMVGVVNPSVSLLAKLGSIAVYVDEGDLQAARALLPEGGEVRAWLRGFEVQYPNALPGRRR